MRYHLSICKQGWSGVDLIESLCSWNRCEMPTYLEALQHPSSRPTIWALYGRCAGEATSNTFDGVTAKTRQVVTKTAAAAPTSPSAVGGCGLGFCIALAMNPLNGTNHQYHENLGYDVTDDYNNTLEDQLTSEENPRIKAITDGRENVWRLNPPVQLDLLPLTPVFPLGPLQWSSDNGSSDGGSSRNNAPRKGSDVNSMMVETSYLRQDFSSYVRSENVIGEMERASRASDEEENGIHRKKLRLSKQQSAYLEESFKDHSTLNPIQKLEHAKKLNLSPRQVEVWTKLKQTEVDCEYLKKCCETLRGENRKLHKELQELRALKTTSNPFCLQLPATTLAMCGSCVRVAATTFTTTTSAFRSAPPPHSTPNTNLRESMSTETGTSFPLSLTPRSLYPFPYTPPCDNSHP
ncbi:hypothetical protein L6452_36004 [Arctium lappa]|uniref:Uncharacterized protein n=1 Tax=Arctium lappa TaxID=4217 RepID=A0ACB8YC70_ARCLA|nr:hypothetical protein L6452_36004 [Arctium lappa]